MRRLVTLAALAGCSPAAPDYVPPQDADLSYGIGWVVRVEDDACGFADDQAVDGFVNGVIQVENRYRTTPITATVVDFACDEEPWGTVLPGDALAVGAPVGFVVRIATEDGEVLSAWEILFTDGGTLVIQ